MESIEDLLGNSSSEDEQSDKKGRKKYIKFECKKCFKGRGCKKCKL